VTVERLDELSICVCRWQLTQNPPHDNLAVCGFCVRTAAAAASEVPTGSEAVCLDAYLAHPVDSRPFFAGISVLMVPET
jgi:hypothetical protein